MKPWLCGSPGNQHPQNVLQIYADKSIIWKLPAAKSSQIDMDGRESWNGIPGTLEINQKVYLPVCIYKKKQKNSGTE